MSAGSVLRAAAALFFLAPAAAAADLNWTFDVLLDGKNIGYHEFSVREEEGRQILETKAEFDVRFLFVTAYRYRHQNTEAWQNNCLQEIDARTNSNGKAQNVQGERKDSGFVLQTPKGNAKLPGCVQTFAYWRPDVLEANRLLNSQTGELEDVSVTLAGNDVVNVGGEAVPALRYRLSAAAGDITLWYAVDDQRWLALEAPGEGRPNVAL